MEAETSLNCAKKRLEMELGEIDENPPTHISFGPVNHDDLFLWDGIIIGHMDTPFEGDIFHLSIQFPCDYPFSPPEVKFLTKVYHPNIDDEDGTIHLKILGEEWSPPSPQKNYYFPSLQFSWIQLWKTRAATKIDITTKPA